jgi:hypothetical protein
MLRDETFNIVHPGGRQLPFVDIAHDTLVKIWHMSTQLMLEIPCAVATCCVPRLHITLLMLASV